jgi:hypothetical protein
MTVRCRKYEGRLWLRFQLCDFPGRSGAWKAKGGVKNWGTQQCWSCEVCASRAISDPAPSGSCLAQAASGYGRLRPFGGGRGTGEAVRGRTRPEAFFHKAANESDVGGEESNNGIYSASVVLRRSYREEPNANT